VIRNCVVPGRPAMPANRPTSEVPSHHPNGLLRRRTTRRRWLRRTIWGVAALTALAVLVGVAMKVTVRPSQRCAGSPVSVTVAASSSQFPALSGLADRWSATAPSVAGRCAAVSVAHMESRGVASALGPNWDEARDGRRPDVWVPESTFWLLIAASHPNAKTMLPDHAPSTASSPIVLATRKPVAAALGWPKKPLGWE